jgi:hypothetical protein
MIRIQINNNRHHTIWVAAVRNRRFRLPGLSVDCFSPYPVPGELKKKFELLIARAYVVHVTNHLQNCLRQLRDRSCEILLDYKTFIKLSTFYLYAYCSADTRLSRTLTVRTAACLRHSNVQSEITVRIDRGILRVWSTRTRAIYNVWSV